MEVFGIVNQFKSQRTKFYTKSLKSKNNDVQFIVILLRGIIIIFSSITFLDMVPTKPIQREFEIRHNLETPGSSNQL
jgi:hypothetical protein